MTATSFSRIRRPSSGIERTTMSPSFSPSSSSPTVLTEIVVRGLLISPPEMSMFPCRIALATSLNVTSYSSSRSGMISTLISSSRVPLTVILLTPGSACRSSRSSRTACFRSASSPSPNIATEMTGRKGSKSCTLTRSRSSGRSGSASISRFTSLRIGSASSISLKSDRVVMLNPSETVDSTFSTPSMSLTASSILIVIAFSIS